MRVDTSSTRLRSAAGISVTSNGLTTSSRTTSRSCAAVFWVGLVLLGLLATVPLQAQVSIVQPVGAPTTNDVIIARVQYIQSGSCSNVIPTTLVNGNTIRTDVAVSNCTPLLPFLASAFPSFGPLPAGTYTYEAYVSIEGGPSTLAGTTTIVVLDAAVPVPLLDTTSLLILAITLCVLAVTTLRRVS